MQITNISDAKANLSRLIHKVETTHEPIIIGKAGKPVAVLSVYDINNAPRVLTGNWQGKVTIADDFDEELTNNFYESELFPPE